MSNAVVNYFVIGFALCLFIVCVVAIIKKYRKKDNE